MQTLMYVMAILGCGESDAACREIRIDQQSYQTEASCRAATSAVLARHTDLEFPTVVARCRRSDARPAIMRGTDVLRPGGGRLQSVQTAPRYASRWVARAPARSSR
jgi:hypothetical protein